MTYQVSRDGQMYGPYTLQDLHRYIASGHILPSDLVKREGMPDWVCVADLPASENPSGSTPPPAAPPYVATSFAPTAATVGANTYPDPPDLPWLLTLLLGILTGGLFFLAWDLVIAAWARRVEPRSQALPLYIAATVLVILNAGASYGIFLAALQHQAMHGNALGSLLGFAAWIVRLVARFSLRNTLEAHFNVREPLGLRLSGVMTFFFGGLYFQNRLNAVNDTKRALRYGAGTL